MPLAVVRKKDLGITLIRADRYNLLRYWISKSMDLKYGPYQQTSAHRRLLLLRHAIPPVRLAPVLHPGFLPRAEFEVGMP